MPRLCAASVRRYAAAAPKKKRCVSFGAARLSATSIIAVSATNGISYLSGSEQSGQQVRACTRWFAANHHRHRLLDRPNHSACMPGGQHQPTWHSIACDETPRYSSSTLQVTEEPNVQPRRKTQGEGAGNAGPTIQRRYPAWGGV